MLYIKCFRIFKRITDLFLGYPRYDRDYIRRHIDLPTTDSHELQEYIGYSSRRASVFRAALVLVSLLNSIRNLLIPITIAHDIDVTNVLGSVKLIESNESQAAATAGAQGLEYSFSCLTTNCSSLTLSAANQNRLSSFNLVGMLGASPTTEQTAGETQDVSLDLLAPGLVQLPFYRMCRSHLAQRHLPTDPTAYLGTFGLYVSIMAGVSILLTGVVTPIVQAITRNNDLFCVSVLAPKVTRKLIERRAKRLTLELIESFENFRHISETDEIAELITMYTRNNLFSAPKRSTSRGSLQHAAHHDELASLSDCLQLRINPRQLSRFARDCLPSNRSDWWSRKVCRSTCAVAAFVWLSVSLVIWGIYFASIYLMSYRRQYLDLVAAQTRESNCSVWLVDQADEHRPVDYFSQLDLTTPLRAHILFVCQTYPIYCFGIYCFIYMAINSDIFVWLRECEFQLKLGIEYTRQLKMINSIEGETFQNGRTKSNQFDMDIIRRKFQSLTDVFMLLVVINPMHKDLTPQERSRAKHRPLMLVLYKELLEMLNQSRLDETLAVQSYVSKTIAEYNLNLESLVELLQKLLISHRIFIEHIHLYAPTIAILILFFVLANYCAVITGVLMIKLLKFYAGWTFVLVLGAWLVCNFIVLLAANFHAKSCKMQSKIWSLIGQTCDIRDIRIQHMRSLWFRQALSSSAIEGHAFNAFEIRITYVNIIQSVFWSGTIAAIVLRA